jgi:antitoxin HigA-1
MSVNRNHIERPPTLPGRFIQHDILEEHGLTQEQLAQRLRVSRLTVNELVKGRRAVTAIMALRLERLTGQSAGYWLALQKAVDLWEARKSQESHVLEEIEPLIAPNKVAD